MDSVFSRITHVRDMLQFGSIVMVVIARQAKMIVYCLREGKRERERKGEKGQN